MTGVRRVVTGALLFCSKTGLVPVTSPVTGGTPNRTREGWDYVSDSATLIGYHHRERESAVIILTFIKLD